MTSFSNLELNNHCYICGRNITEDSGTRDHFVPKYLGGSNCVENLRPTCHFCNSKKNSHEPTLGLLFTVLVANIIISKDSIVEGTHLEILRIDRNTIVKSMYSIIFKPRIFGTININIDPDDKSWNISFSVSEVSEPRRMKDIIKIANRAIKQASKHLEYLEKISKGEWPKKYWRGYLCGVDDSLLSSSTPRTSIDDNNVTDNINTRDELQLQQSNLHNSYKQEEPYHSEGGIKSSMAECAICGKHIDFHGEGVKLICPECTAVICKFNLIDASILYLLRSRQAVAERLQDIVTGIMSIPEEDSSTQVVEPFMEEDTADSEEIEADSFLKSFPM